MSQMASGNCRPQATLTRRKLKAGLLREWHEQSTECRDRRPAECRQVRVIQSTDWPQDRHRA